MEGVLIFIVFAAAVFYVCRMVYKAFLPIQMRVAQKVVVLAKPHCLHFQMTYLNPMLSLERFHSR